MDSCDVIVVGGGPTGLACAIECQRMGLSELVLEKGCVVQSLVDYPINMTFFTTPDLLEIGDIPMTCIRDKPTRVEAMKYYRRVAEHYGLRIRQYETVEEIAGRDGSFEVRSRDLSGRERCTRARKVILATGYYGQPNLLGVPGEDLPKVSHYYREAHPYFDADVAVIGAKNSAAIAALELYRSGARVTLIHRGLALSDSIKYWIRPDIENRIKAGEVRALFNTEVREIQPDRMLVRGPEGQHWLKNDFVLALTGYHPDLKFLAGAGVELDPATNRPRVDTETLESAVPGLYLAGVIVAGMHTSEIFIENGRFHGRQIARDIAGKLKPAPRGA